MDIIYLKIKIKKSDKHVEDLRNEGLFFHTILESLNLEHGAIEEIDENNYRKIIYQINKTFGRNDKS